MSSMHRYLGVVAVAQAEIRFARDDRPAKLGARHHEVGASSGMPSVSAMVCPPAVEPRDLVAAILTRLRQGQSPVERRAGLVVAQGIG
jgi:hypothetical protein